MRPAEDPPELLRLRPDDAVAVLHVDDDPSFGELCVDLLEQEATRLTVETTTTPSDALDRLETAAVDCVVSDYEMPGQDGIAFLKTVRERHPKLPFILFTGKGSEQVASEAISAGVSDYLEKGAGTEQFELLANRILTHVDQTRTREVLERRESHLRQAQTVANIGSWHKDIRADEIYWSDEVYEIFAIEEGQRPLDHETFLSHVHPADSEAVDRAWQNALDGEEYDIEHRIVRGDGETRWVRERAQVTFQDGDPVAALGVVQDISDRKDREGRIRETTARLEALFENSPDMINVHDTAGNIVDPNPRLCEKTGYESAELTEMKVWELDVMLDEAEARELWQSMEPGERNRMEGEFRCKDGSTFPVEVHIRRLDLEGLDRFVVISRDISRQKAQAEKLERQNDRLEQLISTISHDLRNPLSVATSRLELAQLETENEHLDDVGDALDRMGMLIEDVLELAREGDRARTIEPVDLAATARESWKLVPTADATLEVATDRTISADRGRFLHLLENLFQNAVDHGGADVTVTVGALEDGFFVADDGAGIPVDQREKLFDSGFTTDVERTGFGLAIVQEIVNVHDWEITVTECDDGGARFEITNVSVDE